MVLKLIPFLTRYQSYTCTLVLIPHFIFLTDATFSARVGWSIFWRKGVDEKVQMWLLKDGFDSSAVGRRDRAVSTSIGAPAMIQVFFEILKNLNDNITTN